MTQTNEKKTDRKLACIVTGRVLAATKDYYNRKLEKLGSDEKVRASYICKEAKDLIKKGYTVDKVREMLNIDPEGLDPVPQEIIDDIVDPNKKIFRRINGMKGVSAIINSNTEPEVRKFIESLKNE